MQLYTTPRGTWICVCKESFGLQPVTFATLCALVAWDRLNAGEPMPVAELFRGAQMSAGFYRINATGAPGELMRMGLARRIGPPQARSYAVTAAGVRRLGQ